MRRSKWSVLLALLLAMSLVAAACGGDDDDAEPTDEGEPQVGGTLIFGAEQEPAVLNTALTAGNLAWAHYTVGAPIFEGFYSIQPDFSYEPQLLAGEPEVTEDPFTVTYSLHPDATWSDGTPITSEDVEFTLQTIMDKKNDVVSRDGYELITETEIIDDKTIKFTFEDVFAPYRELFSLQGHPLPKHALQGENFNKVWNNEIVNPKTGEPIASGPFLFEEWKKGSEITIVRNDNYWGEHTAYLDEVVFRFVEDTNTEIQALRGQEVDMIYPQVQLALTELEGVPGVVSEVDLGPIWQHLDFQFDHPALAQDFVRQAIAHGIDREAIVKRLVQPFAPDAEPLQNLIYVSNQEQYEDHFGIWNFDPAAATQLLEDNGCTTGGDGIYECDGEKLSFGYVSTAGNELRELMFQIIQAQLKDVGIQVKNEFSDPAVSLGEQLPAGDFDIIQFAWVGSPDPFGGNSIWLCEGGLNYNNYCNEDVTDLINQTNRALDPAERASLYNQADELMAQDLTVLPLWQAPQPFYYYDHVHGVDNNSTQQGITWNVGDWWIEQ